MCIREEEVLLVNGTPITLEGEEGKAIKVSLIVTLLPPPKCQKIEYFGLIKREGFRLIVKFILKLGAKTFNVYNK